MRLPLVLLALALTGCGTADPAPLSAPTVARPQQTVREGDRVTAAARVVAVPGRPVRLCGSTVDAGPAYAPGQEPAPAYCPFGVDVEGVDLGALSDARTKDGATEGRARVEGVWRAGVVVVDRQEPDEPPRTAPARPPDRVPCDEPAGGWPAAGPGDNLSGDGEPALQRYLEAHPGQVSWLALRRPAPGRIALAVGVHDAAERAEAERLLRADVGEGLCLHTPRTTDAQLAAVAADPALQPGAASQVFAGGTGLGPDTEPVHGLGVTMVTPGAARSGRPAPPRPGGVHADGGAEGLSAVGGWLWT